MPTDYKALIVRLEIERADRQLCCEAAQALRDLTAENAAMQHDIEQLHKAASYEANRAESLKAAGGAMAKYTRHKFGCGADNPERYIKPCVCGLSAALAAWERFNAGDQANTPPNEPPGPPSPPVPPPTRVA